jgi:hypothetical protein
MPENNDEYIIKQFEKHNINSNFLAADKNYLYNTILQSLNEFHKTKTISLIIKDLIISIEILFYKGLFNESLKLIAQAEKQARKIDHLVLILEILNWKKKCVGYAFGIERAYEVNTEIANHILILDNFKEITSLYYDSYILKLKNESKKQETIIEDHKIILENPLMKNDKSPKSFTAKLYWYLIFIDYNYLLQDKKNEYVFLISLIKHMESNSFYATENPLDYVSVYSRLLASPLHKKSKTFFQSINHLRNFSDNNDLTFSKELISQRIFVITSIAELEWYLINNDYKSTEVHIKHIKETLKNITRFIEPFYLIQLYYYIIASLFALKQYNKAMDYINFVLNEYKEKDRPNFYQRIEFFNIIIHFELKSYSLVQHLLKKLKRNKEKEFSFPIKNLIKTIEMIVKKPYQQKEYFDNFITSNLETEINTTDILNDLLNKWVISKVK